MYNDPNSDWNFSLVGTKVLGRERSGVERSSVNGRNKVDDATTINLILRNDQLLTGLSTSLVVTNLLDEDNFEPSDGRISGDYPLEGRSVRMEFTYSLN